MASTAPGTMPNELLQLMQAGDLRALDAFARRYSRRLLAVARRRCHLDADAEDAVQQALLVASASMTSIRGAGSEVAWLSTLVARTCSRFNARAARFESLPGEDESCDCEADPHVAAEREELSVQLERALMSVSRTDRLAFMLSVDGLDGVEIAEQLGLTHDAVRSRLKRVRRHVRERLEPSSVPQSSEDSGRPARAKNR